MQLHHELPDGTWHIDWMLATDPAGTEPLITFRLPGPLDDVVPEEPVISTRLDDHRAAYLTYEGPISRNRGVVRRIASGTITAVEVTNPQSWMLSVLWHGQVAPRSVRLHASTAPTWLIRAGDGQHVHSMAE